MNPDRATVHLRSRTAKEVTHPVPLGMRSQVRSFLVLTALVLESDVPCVGVSPEETPMSSEPVVVLTLLGQDYHLRE